MALRGLRVFVGFLRRITVFVGFLQGASKRGPEYLERSLARIYGTLKGAGSRGHRHLDKGFQVAFVVSNPNEQYEQSSLTLNPEVFNREAA